MVATLVVSWQNIGWFDLEENNTGAICARLARDVQLISDATGGNLGRIVMNFCCLGIGIILACAICWQLALLAIATVPLNALGAAMQLAMMSGNSLLPSFLYTPTGPVSKIRYWGGGLTFLVNEFSGGF